jgi:hypothetical protein
MMSRRPSSLVALLILLLGTGCRPRRDCPAGQSSCSGSCVDTAIDSKNCGACASSCPSDRVCYAGGCLCAANLTECAGLCADLRSSFADCGACSRACAPGTACFSGQCEVSCPADAGVINCSGSCVDPTSDPHNCGGCSRTCRTIERCENGSCSSPDLFAVCFSGTLVGYHSRTGEGLPAFTVSVPRADGGSPIVPGGLGLFFSDAKTLWLLDTINSLVDVLDVTAWPPSVLGSVPIGQAPNQILLCAGLMLVVNSVDGTLQGIDLATRQTVNEVSLGAGSNPYLVACDGAHTAYVSDYASGDLKAVDLGSWTVTATLTVPAQDFAPGARPYPQGVAYAYVAGEDAGSVFVSLGNAIIDGGTFAPLGDALVLELDPALGMVHRIIDPGAQCTNGGYLAVSPDGTEVLESCTGLYLAEASGFVAPIATADGQVGPLIQVPLPNPSTAVFLRNGLVAVDGSGNGVALLDRSDGGVVRLLSPCPVLTDGGTVTGFDFVGGLAAAP